MAEHVKATRARTVAPPTPHRAPPIPRMAPAVQAHRAHVRGTLGRYAAKPAPLIQAKLRVGAVDDPLEHEADRLADRVMRMPEPTVQRACCAGCASGGACADEVQREATSGPVLAHGGHVDASLVSSLGPGRPLPTAERAFFEPRFGADLSAVRLHTGAQARTAARAIDARAFTYGSDIALAPREFQPGTHAGRRLMAHELTHVVQQASLPPLIQPKTKRPDDEPVRSRRAEIALSKSSPGQFEIGSGFPPVMSLFNFAINDYSLKPEHEVNLRILGKLFGLIDTSQWQVSVVGHADSTGGPEINDPLSAKRADAVRNFLNAVLQGNYFIQGQGENRPVATNESVSGRTRNRRVDILFLNPDVDTDIPDPVPNVCQLYPSLCDEDQLCSRYPFLCGKGFCEEHPGWCGLGVLCLLFPPACACLRHPVICACGRFPALCACLANPKACLRSLRKPKDKPKRRRACPTVRNLPSGVIEANKVEEIGFAKLSYPFKMEIDFVDDPTGCDCACGEYIQRVRGFFERDKTGRGQWERERKKELTSNVFLDEAKFQEDGIPGLEEYGHRFWDDDTRIRPKPNEKEDAFWQTRATGCEYRGSDEPGMESKQHRAKIRMYLEFEGGAVDVCEVPGERRVMPPHQRSWIIHGQAQVKPPPPGPIKPATDSPSTTTPDVTEAEETDIRQGKPSPSWYAGGIPSHATSGTYRMVVGFEVGGTTKYSLVGIRIAASHPDFITVITTNKRNLNLNPDDPKNPVIVEPNHREQIQRSILEKVEQALTPQVTTGGRP